MAPLNASRRSLLRLAGAAVLGAPFPSWANFEAVPWPRGMPLPAFDAQDTTGKAWRLADLRGRAVLLNFWASWCEPCRAEMPTLQLLAEIYGPAKLAVVTVNFKETAAKAAQFAAATGLSLPVVLDTSGAIARAWGVKVFPGTMLVGADGRPRTRIRGEVDWSGAEAEKLVAPLLAKA